MYTALHRPLRWVTGILVVLILAPAVCAAQSNDRAAAKVDEIFSQLTDAKSPGVAVLVRRDGETVFKRGYGVRDLRTRAKIDAHTNFRLASCTKQFTAMSIMLLVHDGKLRYEEPLTEVFPDFPTYGKTITIRNLLNHTGGLPDYEDLMDKASAAAGHSLWTESKQIQDAEVLALLKKETQGKFAPGSKWSYSNSGYVVLGQVVAKVSGKSFPNFLQERIFGPLNMTKTVAYVRGKNEVPNRAFGHSNEKGALAETDQSSTSATLGDGGVYSNLEDLALWDDALRNHTLLSEKEMAPALQPVRLPDGSLPHWSGDSGDTDPQAGKPVSYGFGWYLDSYKGHPRTWHYGDTIGFKSAIDRFTQDGLTIIVLTNRSDFDAPALAVQVADICLSAK